MATITFRLSKKKNAVGQSEIMMRFRHGDIDLYTKCNVFVFPNQWDNKKQSMIVSNIRAPKLKTPQTLDEYRKKVADNTENSKCQAILNEFKNKVVTSFNGVTDKKSIDKDWLTKTIHPEYLVEAEANLGFFEIFDLYLKKHQFPYGTEKGFNVLMRTLKRYELFKLETDRKKKDFHLNFDYFNTDEIEDFESYIRNEYTLFKEYPKIFNNEIHKPHPRGNNTVSVMMRRLRLFFNWCFRQGYVENNPFERYEGKPEKYGTPFYITIDERNIIADFDLSKHPSLAIQRDIFIFQCCIGCRVSDLLNLTKDNIINGAIEYIPQKTKDEKKEVRVIRVPLNDRAAALVNKYEEDNNNTGKLFPFISSQKYNDAIKEIFTLCGITRLVTVLNPITGNEEKKPLNEVASSHLARRTFVGNLYKQVKDPNLVGSLSGHVEGSKAFARYRNIDEEMKKELVKLID